MWLKQISIHGFGKLRIFELNLNDSLNILHGPNEAGKTSFACFLLNALSEPGEELQRYEPWEYSEFGGEIQYGSETLSVDFVNRNFSPPYKRSLLESIGFIFEEEKFDLNNGVDGTVVATLKRKMEETDTGRILSLSIEKLDNLIVDIPAQISNAKEAITSIENKIEASRNDINYYNVIFKQKKTLVEKIKTKESELVNFEKIFSSERKKYISDIKGNASKLENELNLYTSRFEEIKWVETKSKEELSKASKLSQKEAELQGLVENTRNVTKELSERRSATEGKLNGCFDILKIDASKELEKVFLKIKNLTFLKKMYREKGTIEEEYAAPEPNNPLWDFYAKNENILDDVEDAEKNSDVAKEKISKEIASVQDKLKKINPRFFISKYTAILFSVLALASLCSKFLYPAPPSWILILSGVSAFIAAIAIYSWIKSSKARSNTIKMMLDMEEYSAQNAWYNKPGIWKTLNELGIQDKTSLRKTYIEYINYSTKTKNQPTQENHIDQIENEIVSILSEFEIDDDKCLSIDGSIAYIEKIYNEAQEHIANLISFDEQLKSHKINIEHHENEIKLLQGELSEVLIGIGMNISEVNSFEEYYSQYQEMKLKISELTSEIDHLNKKINFNYVPEKLNNCNMDVLRVQNELKDLNEELTSVTEKLEGISIDSAETIELHKQKDNLLRKLETLKAIPKRLSIIKELGKKQLNFYIGNFGKKFKEEFSYIFNSIVDRKVPVAIKDNLTISLPINGKLSNPESNLSKSTYDQMLFAYKLSLYRILSDVKIPLIIDNAFMNYDDQRLKNAMDIIIEESKNRQVIVLTSDKRIVEYSKTNVIDFNQYSM